MRALLDMAAQVRTGQLHGYYIFAHSLGTVVAFNGMMELSLTLPNYLTEEEWSALHPDFKQQAPSPAPANQMPRRPPWLGPQDAINRSRIFEGLRGFLTMGSPLDKFAALWPVIVPINAEAIPGDKPWINVADRQDIVAGSIDLFPPCDPAPGVGGLQLINFNWADRLWPLSAHTYYWRVGKTNDRLINRIIAWLEGTQCQAPGHRYSPWLARPLFWFLILFPSAFLLTFLAWIVRAIFSEPFCTSILPVLCISSFSFLQALGSLVGLAVLVVLVCSTVRRLWEEFYLGSWERRLPR